MDSRQIKSYQFDKSGVETLGVDAKETNWPVVYQIYNKDRLYVGETTNLKNRMAQHIQNADKQMLEQFSVVFNDTYNKSVALDLESHLIQWFSGDGKYKMVNKNDGIAHHDYYDRPTYQKHFRQIWDELRKQGIAEQSIEKIENSGLFKFSPYKSLSESQLEVVSEVLTDLDESFKYDSTTVSVIGGNEGTGKTIVLMYLIKLLRDIQDYDGAVDEQPNVDQNFKEFYQEPFNSRFKDKSIAVVIPNQSLRGSITKIFNSIVNLRGAIDVLAPVEFGASDKTYDITFVDEAHLLKAGNQAVHKALREKVDLINQALFNDGEPHTELDWIIKKSKNVIMVYGDQRVRPNNILAIDIKASNVRQHVLKSQMRSKGGELYIDYLRRILSNEPPIYKETFSNFEFKLYDDFNSFVQAIRSKDAEFGLSRLVAGFAWDWLSKKDKKADDIVIDGVGLKWNSTLWDWVGSTKSADEVGSIYTIQGYDLNYCGVIIGNDLRYDPQAKRLILDRKYFFDRGAKKRTKQQIDAGFKLTDEELLDQVLRTYRILMNRSVKGTYVYVCDDGLREYLRTFVESVT